MVLKILEVAFNFHQNSLTKKIKFAIIIGLLKCQFFILINKQTDISFSIGGYKLIFPNPKVLRYLIKEILMLEEYYIELENNEPVIMDCGSNLGMSILYFKLKYPKSEIIGIEADPFNFHFLKMNVKDMANVRIFNKFITVESNKKIKFYSGGAGDLRSSFNRTRGGNTEIEVDSLSISELVEGQTVDLIKMDIEGGEGLIFNSANELNFLNKCKNLIIEYHHNLDTPIGSLSSFLNCFEEYPFTYQIQSSFFNKYSTRKAVIQDLLFTFKKI
jgi:FkbM family methyltransferase